MEVAVIPEIVALGCDLLTCLARRYRKTSNNLFIVLTYGQIILLSCPALGQVIYHSGFSTRANAKFVSSYGFNE